ncbi:bifunctional demethylmenaquinone methyltransferase/2-methoxy-6-polyprenyl-1,4-benzoquinol methylase UbiE [Helicobacter pylori]|uniref:bifunctional demethylmenaquinone methyltransferase/2-methoxy-6-polyprenyl-1,4-benzoquinol methylase UbiE n=1 Tax=Helicobacter pylori TaxID=210 RepID=UPI000D36C099|nr:bifunctional demethylmenaquinone methyltransferase/2-methoxy-6-polyprenyl-1,4-benzoquinol methylase UbiE [Helicobacter pylori]PUD36496.1 bifunctional demethylmenaquinone methyltransferase/2-methoxy-6-polyprenyl-1,4-benzoquinol methylase UbiE [Helicobacter pylori]
MKKEKHLKQEKIISMFDGIASSYDQANRLMSFGLDVKWRERACEHAFLFLENKKALRLVDVACGTGDMLVAWQKSTLNCGIEFKECLGIDPSNNMLALAEKKLENKASFIQAQAKDLKSVGNNSVDILSIAYGLRNIVERQEALKEFFRVLKPRGVLVILEFLKKDNPTWLDKISGFYTNKVLPLVGGAISKNYGAYSYLPQSIEGFLSLEGLKHELKNAGFEILRTQDSIAQISTTMLVRKS